jgi:2-oxoglutarate ferredoxin oxidoreductase subunit alpha
VRIYGSPEASIGVVGWGSTFGPIREAVEEANKRGVRVAALHTNMVYPLPEKELSEFLAPLKSVIVPELNYTGQFAVLLKSRFCKDFHQLNKVEGLPFSSVEILEKILEVANA